MLGPNVGSYLKQVYIDACDRYWKELAVQQIDASYEKLFRLHSRLLTEIGSIEGQIDSLEKLVAQLRNSEGKDDQTIIKDKWQALKVEEVLELSRVVRLKLYELIDVTPEKPKAYVS